MELPEDVVGQAANCFATIDGVLQQGGFTMADIVRVQYTLVDRSFLDALKPELENALGKVRPAATMVIAGLLKPEMKIEIEVTAYRDRS
jgi:enamine deaminase RidA (YjgF/YER057c/UK114 family)